MAKVVGVRFRSSGKVYYFDPGLLELKMGSHVLVETVRGLEYGTVAGAPRELEDEKVPQPLRTVVRAASEEDEARAASDREKEKEAVAICREKIREHGLDMKLIDAEYTFDHNKILFYFTADGRIDFRELVKDLASVFRTRIELRQIGVRDETKMLGGIGICGRPLCCHTYLSDFTPVSIKMAKEQNLSLNPSKISGVCGRLMCCLKNEEDTYEYLNSLLPSVGDEVETPEGITGEVSSVNVLRQRVRVLLEEDDEKELHEYGAGELKVIAHHGKPHKNGSRGRQSREPREKADESAQGNGPGTEQNGPDEKPREMTGGSPAAASAQRRRSVRDRQPGRADSAAPAQQRSQRDATVPGQTRAQTGAQGRKAAEPQDSQDRPQSGRREEGSWKKERPRRVYRQPDRPGQGQAAPSGREAAKPDRQQAESSDHE